MSDTSESDDGEEHHRSEAENTPDDEPAETEEDERDHLIGVEDGCGCAEVWEHLSERRNESDD